MNRSIGENIRKIRTARGLSQLQLADKLNVDRSSVASWETGRRSLDAGMISRLAGALEVDANKLLSPAQSDARPVVMIVDDERVIMRYNASVIKKVIPKAETVCFTKPSDAVEYAEDHRVDLALLDIEMGMISGLDVCRELLRSNPRTNVVYLTAYREYSFDAWETGAGGYMLKPLTPDAVREQLCKLRFPLPTGDEES
ncbi:MAG: response regulator [Ruminococcus sp.]|nr:response regulator [Ruminococcus sp.]